MNNILDDILCLIDKTDNKVVKANLVKAFRSEANRVINNALGVKSDKLNTSEILLGQNSGKIPCIKAVRERLDIGLKEAKDLAEGEFIRLGYTFKGYDRWGRPL